MPAYEELESEVIEGGLCTYCGACVTSCPLHHLKWIDARPKRPEKGAACEDCEVCYHACYRTEFKKEAIEEEIFGGREGEDIGTYKRILAAEASDERILEKAQDGGVVTAILVYMLEQKIIDGAILTGTGREKEWMPTPVIARSKEEIISAAGTKYGISPNLLKVRTAIIDELLDNICIVGLPCHVRAVRHLQHIKFELAPAIKFVIGLFCMANFEYEQMSRWIKERGMEMKDVEKMSTSKGFFNANTGDTKLSIPLKETEAWHSKHCQACDDYSAELADISIGSDGSKERWSSVIIRTESGEEVFSELKSKGYIRTKEIDDSDHIKVNTLRKKKKWKR